MKPDWKLELQSREPVEHPDVGSLEDPAAGQRMYEQSAVKWCLQAGEEHEKAKRLRREARIAETLVIILVLFVLYLVKK